MMMQWCKFFDELMHWEDPTSVLKKLVTITSILFAFNILAFNHFKANLRWVYRVNYPQKGPHLLIFSPEFLFLDS